MEPQEIRKFRKQKGINQEALGKLCGVGKSTVSEWESGKARPSGSAAILLENYFQGAQCIVPLTKEEERLMDEAVRQGNFINREEFLAACLVHLIRNGEIRPVSSFPTGKRP